METVFVEACRECCFFVVSFCRVSVLLQCIVVVFVVIINLDYAERATLFKFAVLYICSYIRGSDI